MPSVRDIARARFDVVIVGGGIYGIMCALEAVRRDLRPLVLERRKFAGATSRNSLKILHGGFRYLQSADFPRFFESVRERRWFLRHFPELARPFPCLMPLYGEGLRRGLVLTAALALNDVLSAARNAGVMPDRRLPRGRFESPEKVVKLFPHVDRRGLEGGAVWYDAVMASDEELARAVLAWAESLGAVTAPAVEALHVSQTGGAADGVVARDAASGEELFFRAPRVINAGGPWAGAFARASGSPHERLEAYALAWNIAVRRPPFSGHGVALTARRRGAQTYFAVPWRNELLIGTGYAPWRGSPDDLALADDVLAGFLGEINEAVPGLALQASDVTATFTGLLPATAPGAATLSRRPLVIDHGARGGAGGFYTLSGIKYTTARAVADTVLSAAFPGRRRLAYEDLARDAREPIEFFPER